MIVLSAFRSWFRFRGSLLAPLVFISMMFVIEGSFWTSMSHSGGVLAHYSQNQLLIYVLSALVISQINAVIGEPDQLAGRIESGDLETFLTRPISLLYQLGAVQVGMTLARLVVFVPILIAIQIYFSGSMALVSLFGFLSIIFASSLLNFFINFGLSTLTFYFREAYAFVVFKETLWWILSGALIPLDLFSDHLRDLFLFLPSSYVIYYPAKILMGEPVNIVRVAGVCAFWIFVCGGIASWMWALGIRKYQAYGS